jgi:hypothetical protein
MTARFNTDRRMTMNRLIVEVAYVNGWDVPVVREEELSLHTIEELESHSIRYFTDRQELIDYTTSNRSLEGIWIPKLEYGFVYARVY